MLSQNKPMLGFPEEAKIPRTKQGESKFIELWPKRTPDDGKINWNYLLTLGELNQDKK